MASSIVYRCWPAENNARATEALKDLDNYPIYASTREGLVKALMKFLTDGDIFEEGDDLDEELENDRTRLWKDIEKGLDSLGKSYEGRYGVVTVNRSVVSVADLSHYPEKLNLYMEIAKLH